MAKAQNNEMDVLEKAQKASGAQKALRGINHSFSQAIKKFSKFNELCSKAEALQGTVNSFGGFEQSLANIAAQSGATSTQLKAVEAKALELGRKTSKSSCEILSAMDYMSVSGWDLTAAMQAIEPAIRLSEAGNIDLAKSSQLVVDSMASLNMGAEELPKFLDQAAQISKKTGSDVGGLMQAFIGCGTALDNLNIPLDEGNAALGILADRGMKGSQAGEQLNAIITNLSTGTGQAGKAMEALNINAFDEVTGEFKGLENVLKEVNDKTKSLTDEQKNNYFAMIGGTDQVGAFCALMDGMNAANEDGISQFDALQASVAQSEGVLVDMAGIMQGTMFGAMERASSAVEDFKLNAMQGLEPYITTACNWFADKLPQATEAFRKNIAPVMEFAAEKTKKFFDATEKGVEFTVSNWGTIEPILKGIAGAFVLFQGAELIEGTPKAINGIGKAFTDVKKTIVDHADTYKIAGMYAKDYAKVGAQHIGAGFKKMGGFAKTGGKAMASGLGKGFKAVGGIAKAGLGFIASPAGIAVVGITALIAAGILLWKNWDKIKEKATQLKTKIEQGIAAVAQKFPFLGSILEGQFSAIKDVVGGFKTAFEGVVDFVGGVFTGDWQRAWDGVKGIFKGVFESFVGIAKSPINAVISLINGAIQGINSVSVTIPDWVPEWAGGGETLGFAIPEIPMLANGGIATKATLAMVGEGREHEAILPLSKLKQLVSGNGAPAQQVINISLNVGGGANAREFESQLPRIKTMVKDALAEIQSRSKMVSLSY